MKCLRTHSWERRTLRILQQTGPLLAKGPGGYDYVHGTAFIVGHRLALTALHLVTGYLQHIHGIDPFDPELPWRRPRNRLVMTLILLLPSRTRKPVQLEVMGIEANAPGDVALLRLASTKEYPWHDFPPYPKLRLAGPHIGETVYGFGYPRSSLRRTGPRKIAIRISPTPSVGVVRDVALESNDPRSWRLPRFETDADFSPGMSGGPIVDASARICGVVSSSIAFAESGPPVSYGSILWPIASAMVRNKRATKPSARRAQNVVAAKLLDIVDFQELPSSVRAHLRGSSTNVSPRADA